MNVNSVATQPSFTAKVKGNAFMQSYVQQASMQRKEELLIALNKLDKTHKNDVLEITPISKNRISVKNTTIDKEAVFNTRKNGKQKYPSLPAFIEKIATEGTNENKKVFTPPTEAEKQKNEKAKQELINMLA